MKEESGILPGWSVPRPTHLPGPTASPALFALGVTIFAWGIVSSFVLMLFGAPLIAYSLGHWIWEIRHEAE